MFSLGDEEDEIDATRCSHQQELDSSKAGTEHGTKDELNNILISEWKRGCECFSRKGSNRIFSLLHERYECTKQIGEEYRAMFYYHGLLFLMEEPPSVQTELEDSLSHPPSDSRQEEALIFKDYVQHHNTNIQSATQRKYVKNILTQIASIFQNPRNIDTSLRNPSPLRSKLISETTKYFIRYFIPSLQYSTLRYCEEWKGLIQYHCPMLHRQVLSQLPSTGHFPPISSGFISVCEGSELIHLIWDHFVAHQNKALPYYFSIALLMYYKDRLIKDFEGGNHDNIDNLPIESAEHIMFLMDTALQLHHQTPHSINETLLQAESFRNTKLDENSIQDRDNNDKESFFPSTLCMYTSVSELCSQLYTEEFTGADSIDSDTIRFFVIDCRIDKHFAQGSIPNSISFNEEMLHEQPEVIADIIEKMKVSRNSRHFVVLGDGYSDVFPVLAYLIQQNIAHLSVLKGGYAEFHKQALAHSLPIFNHVNHCYICHPHLEPVKELFDKTKESASRLASWLQKFNEEEEMPPSNVIEDPNLKQMLFNLENPLLFCSRILRNGENRKGAILLTDKAFIWLENCSLANEKRTTIEFGYSYGYSLAYLRKITILQSKQVRFSLGTPQDPQILTLLFSFTTPPTLEAIQLIKTRTQILLRSLKEKCSQKPSEIPKPEQ